MSASFTAVPDGIEPFVGYRAWRSVIDGRRASLYSIGGPGSFGSCWDVAVFGWATSACRIARRRLLVAADHSRTGDAGRDGDDEPHLAPQEGCMCGFYAMKELFPVTRFIGSLADIVIGRVDLAGKVIEHDFGYRAERAHIAELIAVNGTERSALRVANRMGLRLAAPDGI